MEYKFVSSHEVSVIVFVSILFLNRLVRNRDITTKIVIHWKKKIKRVKIIKQFSIVLAMAFIFRLHAVPARVLNLVCGNTCYRTITTHQAKILNKFSAIYRLHAVQNGRLNGDMLFCTYFDYQNLETGACNAQTMAETRFRTRMIDIVGRNKIDFG